MRLPDIFEKHLRSHIDFATFILLDMLVIDENKSAVFLVPREDKDYCSIQINDESKFFGSFSEMMDYAIHFKLISEGYRNGLVRRYEDIKHKGGK